MKFCKILPIMRKKSKTIIRLVYLALFILICVGLVIAFLNIFKVKSIQTNAPSKLMNYFPNLDNDLIFFIDEEKIRRHFLNDPVLESVSIEKKYPDKLFINVNKRIQAATILAKNGNYKTDSSGFIFDISASSSAFPGIHQEDKNFNVGNNITHNALKIAVESLNYSKEKGIRFIDIYEGENDTARMILNSGVVVIIGTNLSSEDIISSLQIILKNITIEGSTVKEIDFRFDKPFISV